MSIQAASLYALVSVAGADKSVGDLRRVSNQVNQTQGVLGRMAGATSGWAGQIGRGVGQVGAGLVRIAERTAAAVVIAGGASARAASEFQANMELIHTQAGAGQQEVIDQSKAVQALAHEVGTLPIELAKGLYHIESVGLRGAAALDVLRAGALGAKTGLASMEETTNALTAVSFSGIGGVTSMTAAMGALDAIVGVGNMRLQDLVDSFGTGILGTSKTFGVSLQSMGAALATLTDAGVKAQPAATRMQMMFTHMAAPVPAAIKVMKGLGLSQFDLANDLRKPDGIFVALEDLRAHLIKAHEASIDAKGVFTLTDQGTADVSKMFGGSRFGAAAMQLLGMTDRIGQKYDKIIEQQNMFGDRVAKTMETTRFQWGRFLADLQNAAITFGTAINPALARGLAGLDTFLVSHMDDIRKFGEDVGRAIDGIDWSQVESGAKGVVGVVRSVLDLVKQIPPQVDLAVVSFLGLNKLSGGLLGSGLSGIAQGIGKGVINIGLNALVSRGAAGGAGGIASAFVQRVFVVNMPPGGVGGAGGVPGAPGGARFPMLNLLARLAALTVALDVLSKSNAAPGNSGQLVNGEGFLGNIGGGAVAGGVVGGPIGALIGGLAGIVKSVAEVESDITKREAQQAHTNLGDLAGVPSDQLQIKLAAIDTGLAQIRALPFADLLHGDAIAELEQMRTEVVAALKENTAKTTPLSNANLLASNNNALADRNSASTIADRNNTSTIAAAAASLAASAARITANVPGKVPTVAKLTEIGSTGDPFGFKHLKAFALGKIPGSEMAAELKAHLHDVAREIKQATERGDTATVAKLQQTKAGLELLLGQVKDGTFTAGEKAYAGALLAAAAADRTTAAVKGIKLPNLSHTHTIPGRVAGRPVPTSPPRPGTSPSSSYSPITFTGIPSGPGATRPVVSAINKTAADTSAGLTRIRTAVDSGNSAITQSQLATAQRLRAGVDAAGNRTAAAARAGALIAAAAARAGGNTAAAAARAGGHTAATASHGTTAAVNSLKPVIRGLATIPGRVAGRPLPRRSSGSSDSGSFSLTSLQQSNISRVTNQTNFATGGVGLATMPMQAMFGEAGSEGVAIIRNPRPLDMGSSPSVRVDVHPQPMRLMLNGRELVSALLLQDAFTRRSATTS